MRPTLVLLHGFPLDSTLWDVNVTSLSKAADVVALDLLGAGKNHSSAHVNTMEELAHDVYRALSERGLNRVVLCGLSMGGYVAMTFLERWPYMVEGLILCNTRSTADSEEAKAGRDATAADALDKGMAVIARAMVPKVLSATTRRERPEVAAQLEALMARQDPIGVAAASRGMALRPDRTHVLRGFNAPALVITGAADELMPLPTSQALVDALSKATLVVIPHAGHLTNVEAPEAFNTAVLDYLRAL